METPRYVVSRLKGDWEDLNLVVSVCDEESMEFEAGQIYDEYYGVKRQRVHGELLSIRPGGFLDDEGPFITSTMIVLIPEGKILDFDQSSELIWEHCQNRIKFLKEQQARKEDLQKEADKEKRRKEFEKLKEEFENE